MDDVNRNDLEERKEEYKEENEILHSSDDKKFKVESNIDKSGRNINLNNNDKFKVFYAFTPLTSWDNGSRGKKDIDIKKAKNNRIFLSRKRNRKIDKDNIIKKLKSRFFKCLKQRVLIRLQKVYNYKKKIFQFLPQKFIACITKDKNELIWDKPLFSFLNDFLKDDNKNIIIKHLKEDKIGKMTLKELFNEYLNSKEFKDSIPNDKNEFGVTSNYINDYINNAKNFVNYFTQSKKASKKAFEDFKQINEKNEHSNSLSSTESPLEAIVDKLNRNEFEKIDWDDIIKNAYLDF